MDGDTVASVYIHFDIPKTSNTPGLCASSDRTALVYGSTVVYEITTRCVILRYIQVGSILKSPSLACNGTYIVASSLGQCGLIAYDYADPTSYCTVAHGSYNVMGVSFSSFNSSHLLVCENSRLMIWSMDANAVLNYVSPPTGFQRCTAAVEYEVGLYAVTDMLAGRVYMIDAMSHILWSMDVVRASSLAILPARGLMVVRSVFLTNVLLLKDVWYTSRRKAFIFTSSR